MLVYLAACPDEGCESVDLKKPMWFKSWQAGLLSGNLVDGDWAMAAMVGDKTELRIPVPASVKPGKYLLKHDMANLEGGRVELFAGCVQLDVSGEGTGYSGEELVAFPAGYDKDAGISWANTAKSQGAEWFYIDHVNNTSYSMPGPLLWEG